MNTASITASGRIAYYPTVRQWTDLLIPERTRLGIGWNALLVRIIDGVIDRKEEEIRRAAWYRERERRD